MSASSVAVVPSPPRQLAPPDSPPAWQTAATVLIILHLFALGMGLATNVAGGKSLLAPALVPGPAGPAATSRLLWMNVGYDFHVASPLPEDGSHRLELRRPARAARRNRADAECFPRRFPPPGIQPRIRRQRYQQLALTTWRFSTSCTPRTPTSARRCRWRSPSGGSATSTLRTSPTC